MVRSISTENIKPRSASSWNIIPSGVNTVTYAGYTSPSSINYYGGFKYGAKKYGSTTRYSAGQTMPAISTEAI